MALALASEQGRRGVLVTLVGDVATNYFLLRELDLQLQIARETLRINDETVVYFQNRLDGGVSNRLELDRIQALRAQTAAAIPIIEGQIGVIENLISMLLGRPPGPITRQPLANAELLPPPIPAGLPATLLERRPDVVQAEQVLVSANADIGVAKSLFYPTISLTGFLGGVSGDLTSFLGGSGGVWSLRPRPLPADLSGRAHSTESRGGPGAVRRGAGRISEGGAQQLPRGRELADHDSEAGRSSAASARPASSRCRTPRIWRARDTTPGSRAISRS